MFEFFQNADCRLDSLIEMRNQITKRSMGPSKLAISVSVRLAEITTGGKASKETLELVNFRSQMASTNAIERASSWASSQECTLCPGPSADPTTGVIYCGKSVPDEVIIRIARQD